MINNLTYISTILLLIILIPSKTSEFSSSLNLIYTVIYFILITFFLIRNKRFTKNWVRFDVIFLIGFTIVHIQIPALASLGIEPARPHLVWINKDLVNFATWFSLIAIVFWMWGYSTYKIKIEKKNNRFIEHKINYLLLDSLILSIFILYIIITGSILFSGKYNIDNEIGRESLYIFLFLNVLIYLRIIYFIKDQPKSSNILTIFKAFISNRIFSSIILIYFFIFLLSGDRGPILRILLIGVGSYTIFIKPISFKKLSLFIITGAFILTLIGLGRENDASNFGNKNIFERGYSAFLESDNTNITDELAGSNRILYMALDTVPAQHNFLYGITYIVNIAWSIPFLAGIIVNAFNIPLMYRDSSQFFTITSLGPDPTWGVGSELIADIYINFGVYGVFILMFLFGRFSSKSFSKALSFNIPHIIIYLCLISEAISINRGGLLTPLKPIISMLLINYFFMKIKK